MKKQLAKRLLASVFVLIGVSIIAFLLVRLGGGDPASMLAGDTATPEEIEEYRIRMGLDKPWLIQYFNYILGLFKGDLGFSWTYNMTVADVLKSRLPQTLVLSLFGFGWSCVFSIVFGVIAGVKQGTAIDFGAMFFAIIGQSMATVWLGFLLILVFGVHLKWLPIQGMGTFKHMIMPGLCVGFGYAASQTRLMRSSMVDVIREDYITATRARGISKGVTYMKYAFRNALLPIVTNIGFQFGKLFAGATVVENIFNWPGMGALLIQAINTRDYQMVQSILLISSAMLVVGNLLADILYTVVDPRISFGD